jgi:16S rRNA (cytidine1402-2'-O)-methyltransferase
LSISGIGGDRYVFLGFLPRKGSDRRRLLSTVADSEWTVVLFEAPNRVTQLLADLSEVCGPDRHASVSRELTKVFEETRSGTLQELSDHYADAPVRGEVTVVVAGTGRPKVEERPVDPAERARALLADGLSRKDVADRVAEETGISRNRAYRLVNEL